nr:serine/threonine-protein kinase [Pseudenhygromyxa sp. WMMC2535]
MGTKLGFGGMGTVHRAYDTELQREVALKLVSTRSLGQLDKLRDRLKREALVQAKLDHPNLVTVFDSGVDEGRVFLAMELVEGETLRTHQAREGCDRAERLRLYADAARGLLAAHRRGVVHRDFKPDNVFVDSEGRARVGDFGLAHVLDEFEHDGQAPEPSRADETETETETEGARARLTRAGEVLGTLGYSAPEQLRGLHSDTRSDQFAFCVSLWESLTGELPYPGDSREALLGAMKLRETTLDGRRSAPSSAPGPLVLQGAARLPRRLRRALEIGLSPNPDDRHADMEVLITAIEREQLRPQRTRLGLVLGLAAAIGLFGAFTRWQRHQELNPDCPRADALLASTHSEAWAQLAAAQAGTSARFERRIEALADEALANCIAKARGETQTPADLADIQYHDAIIAQLEQLPVHIEREQLREFSRQFVDALEFRPDRPLSPAIARYIEDEIIPIDLENPGDTSERPPLEDPDIDPHLEDLIVLTNDALEGGVVDALSRSDESELHRRLGEAYTLHGEHEAALDEFAEAYEKAERGADDQRRLQANIERATTQVMRLAYDDTARDHIDSVRALLERLDEPVLSRRRADIDELEGIVLKSQGKYDDAALLLRHAAQRDLFARRRYDLVTRLISLGNLYQVKERYRLAEFYYATALLLDPEDPEAKLNLGAMYVNELEDAGEHYPANESERARDKLGAVLASAYQELHLPATTSLLQLAILMDDRDELTELRRDIEALIDQHRRRNQKRGQGESDDDHMSKPELMARAQSLMADIHLGELRPNFSDEITEVLDDLPEVLGSDPSGWAQQYRHELDALPDSPEVLRARAALDLFMEN